jgi:O-antigen/teichoic acid export membrane protein
MVRRVTASGSVGETTMVNVALLVLGLGSSIATARALGPAGRGVFALATVSGGLALLVVGIGLQQALAFFVARDPSSWPRAVGLATWAGGWLGTAAATLSIVAVALSASHDLEPSLIAVAVSLPAGLAAQNLIGVLQGLQRLRAFNLARLSAPLVSTVLLIVLALTGAATAFEAVLAYALGLCAGLAATTWWLRDVRIARPAHGWAMAVVRYGLVVNIGSIAYQANRQLAVLVVASVGTLADVGRYGVALGYAGPVAAIATAIAFHALPEVAAVSDTLEWRSVAARRIRLAVVGTLPVAVAMVALAPVLIPLVFGDAFRPSIAAAQWLCAALALLGIAHVLHEICRGIGAIVMSATIETLGAGGSLAVLIIVVPGSGIAGAGAVTASMYALTCVALGALVARYGRTR